METVFKTRAKLNALRIGSGTSKLGFFDDTVYVRTIRVLQSTLTGYRGQRSGMTLRFVDDEHTGIFIASQEDCDQRRLFYWLWTILRLVARGHVYGSWMQA